jgi:hypothetical protein
LRSAARPPAQKRTPPGCSEGQRPLHLGPRMTAPQELRASSPLTTVPHHGARLITRTRPRLRAFAAVNLEGSTSSRSRPRLHPHRPRLRSCSLPSRTRPLPLPLPFPFLRPFPLPLPRLHLARPPLPPQPPCSSTKAALERRGRQSEIGELSTRLDVSQAHQKTAPSGIMTGMLETKGGAREVTKRAKLPLGTTQRKRALPRSLLKAMTAMDRAKWTKKTKKLLAKNSNSNAILTMMTPGLTTGVQT